VSGRLGIVPGFDAAQTRYDAQEAPDHGEPLVFPCVGCGEDVGEHYSPRLDMYLPARICPGCERPLCGVCANLDPIMSELCAVCGKVAQ
jgi:hypothetical protein